MLNPTPKLGDVVVFKPAGNDEVLAQIVKVFDAETIGVEWNGKKTDRFTGVVSPDVITTVPVRMGEGDGRWRWPTLVDKSKEWASPPPRTSAAEPPRSAASKK